MTTYYVDNSSPAGSNNNAGTSVSAPFADVTAINSLDLKPGDTVALKAGDTFSGSVSDGGLLNVLASGTASAPITVTSYGAGAAPIIDNTSSSQSANGVTVSGDYAVITGLDFTGAGNAAVEIEASSSHTRVTGNEMSGTGFGVYAYGTNNTIDHNTIHDLHMVNNTPGGGDDYGAVGVVVNGDGDEVAFNRITGAKAASYDFGHDGGAVETWGDVTGLSVHDNYAEGDQGFFEGGGGSLTNADFKNNVSVDDGGFLVAHNGGGDFGGSWSKVVMENNTIVEAKPVADQNATVALDASATSSQISLSNNVVSVQNGEQVFDNSDGNHTGNLIQLKGGSTLGGPLGSGDRQGTVTFADAGAGNYSVPGSSVGANLVFSQTGKTGSAASIITGSNDPAAANTSTPGATTLSDSSPTTAAGGSEPSTHPAQVGSSAGYGWAQHNHWLATGGATLPGDASTMPVVGETADQTVSGGAGHSIHSLHHNA